MPTRAPRPIAEYDERHDVLHIYVAPLAWAWGTEPATGVIIRESEDGRIAGVSIVGFRKWDRGELARLLPFLEPGFLSGVSV